ncbi:MAG: NmrA family NAD(P)-binding protein [Chloroflexota bacterium]|nr:NmrA family NAD(P)-binding protein [Chloroflexota bacterium]
MNGLSSSPLILVTGAAGKTGRAVIRALRSGDAAVRALVRRPQQAAVKRELGVKEVVAGDLMDRESLAQAFRGVDSVYHICPNMHPAEVDIAEGVVNAALAADVRHFAFHSVLHPQTEEMPHHWQKLRVEEMLFQSGLPFTILQSAPYMQNLLAHRQRIVEGGELPMPYRADARLALVDLNDVGAAAATVLLEPGHKDAIYELVGEAALSQRETAAILGQELGRPVTVVEVPLDGWQAGAVARGLDGYRLESLLRMFEYYEAHGLTGNPNVLRWLLGRPPASLASFARREFS